MNTSIIKAFHISSKIEYETKYTFYPLVAKLVAGDFLTEKEVK